MAASIGKGQRPANTGHVSADLTILAMTRSPAATNRVHESLDTVY